MGALVAGSMTFGALLSRLLVIERDGPGGEPWAGPRLKPGDALVGEPWVIKPERQGEADVLVAFAGWPDWFGFETSGHTGTARRWFRHRNQLLAEAELLTELCEVRELDGIVCFAPVHHLYGFLFSVVVAVRSGLPVWYRPLPALGACWPELERPLFVTIPGALVLLARKPQGMPRFKTGVVVHSTALLPAVDLRVLAPLRVVELFGSTETGLVASRRPSADADPRWHLAADVTFAGECGPGSGEVPLHIRGPRLAADETGTPLPSWQMDDFVEILCARTFRFLGRRSSLVKVNGRRVNLDELECVLRNVLPCQDLACVPCRDTVRGEAFDLWIVSQPDAALDEPAVRALGARCLASGQMPRRVVFVQEIWRSATGKLRRIDGVTP